MIYKHAGHLLRNTLLSRRYRNAKEPILIWSPIGSSSIQGSGWDTTDKVCGYDGKSSFPNSSQVTYLTIVSYKSYNSEYYGLLLQPTKRSNSRQEGALSRTRSKLEFTKIGGHNFGISHGKLNHQAASWRSILFFAGTFGDSTRDDFFIFLTTTSLAVAWSLLLMMPTSPQRCRVALSEGALCVFGRPRIHRLLYSSGPLLN